MTASTLTNPHSEQDLRLIEIKPGLRFGLGVLKDLLPDAETALFFAKVYELDVTQLSTLLDEVLSSELTDALFGGDHSYDLQDYMVDDLHLASQGYDIEEITFAAGVVPKGEILPEMWKMLEVDVAKSIKEVAEKLESLVGLMPGKTGRMAFQSMLKLNKQRPAILGTHKAKIHHDPVKENLLILDDSGSVNRATVEAILADCLALGYEANAHLALVSTTTRHWEPGGYDVAGVLARVETGGTQYETLKDLLDRDWGVVICVADYDSSASAKQHIAHQAKGHIDTVLDVSLVRRPSYLAEVVGQLADSVKPLLIATGGTPSQSFNTGW